jgi:DNA-directed RNA polymerase subunit RPC12/RpoP
MKVEFECLRCGYRVVRDEPAAVSEEAWIRCPACERPVDDPPRPKLDVVSATTPSPERRTAERR